MNNDIIALNSDVFKWLFICLKLESIFGRMIIVSWNNRKWILVAPRKKNVLNQWKLIINFGSKHLTLRIDLVYIEIPISFRQRKKNTDQFWSKAFRLWMTSIEFGIMVNKWVYIRNTVVSMSPDARWHRTVP